MTDELNRQHRDNIENARREFDIHSDFLGKGMEFAIKAASDTVKLYATINAGGIIALLGFIGAIAGKEKAVFQSIQPFILPVTLFGIGLLGALLAVGAMYWAQWFYATAPSTMSFSYEHPFIHKTTSSKWLRRCGIFFHVMAVLATFSALGFFIAGLWNCREILLLAKL